MNKTVVISVIFAIILIGSVSFSILSTQNRDQNVLSLLTRVPVSLSLSTKKSKWEPNKLVVIPAMWNEISWNDSSTWPLWLRSGLDGSSQYQVHLYQRKSPNSTSPFQWPYAINVHEEAGLYLKFIFDYYYDLPDKMLFIHGNPYAHSPHPIESALCIRDDVHFASINTVWIQDRPWSKWGKDPADNIAIMYKCANYILSLFGFDGESQLNPNNKQPKDENLISTKCCAQFYVTKQRIHHYTFEQWLRVYHANFEPFCASNRTIEKAGKGGTKWFGGAFEHLWHVILGFQPVNALPPRSKTNTDDCHLFRADCKKSLCSNKAKQL